MYMHVFAYILLQQLQFLRSREGTHNECSISMYTKTLNLASVCIQKRTYIHAYAYTQFHMFVHIHTYIHYIHTYTRWQQRYLLRLRAAAHVEFSMYKCMFVYIHTYIYMFTIYTHNVQRLYLLRLCPGTHIEFSIYICMFVYMFTYTLGQWLYIRTYTHLNNGCVSCDPNQIHTLNPVMSLI